MTLGHLVARSCVARRTLSRPARQRF